MRCVAHRIVPLLMLAAMCSPLAGIEVTLKGEEKPFNAEPVRLERHDLTYRKGRKEETRLIDDFKAESAYALKAALTPREARALLELARFALHRGLLDQTREQLDAAMRLDNTLAQRAGEIAELCEQIEAQRLLERAKSALDDLDAETAEKLLNRLGESFPKTPAAIEGEILRGTLSQVRLAKLARRLEEQARRAQANADAEAAKKRAAVDTWLTQLEGEVKEQEAELTRAVAEAAQGKITTGLPAIENVTRAIKRIRESLGQNEGLLRHDDQIETASRIDAAAIKVAVKAYWRWGFHLAEIRRFAMARTVIRQGIELDPEDRRLLELLVDIDDTPAASEDD